MPMKPRVANDKKCAEAANNQRVCGPVHEEEHQQSAGHPEKHGHKANGVMRNGSARQHMSAPFVQKVKWPINGRKTVIEHAPFEKALEVDHRHARVVVGAEVLARKTPIICCDNADKANRKYADYEIRTLRFQR